MSGTERALSLEDRRRTHGTHESDTNLPEKIIPMKQTWHGHSGFRIEVGEARILIDPFLSDNPSRDNGSSKLPYRQELDTER